MLGCRMKLTLESKVLLGHKLTLEQRTRIMEAQFSTRMQLMEAVYGDRYTPQGICPECNQKLSAVEILKGFTQNPDDITTLCPRCGYRFPPKLIHSRGGVKADMPFYCAAQTLNMLRGKSVFSPGEMMRLHPAVYHSALIHFGTLTNAFSRIAVRYKEPSVPNWRDKIAHFLGLMPDTIIAECVNTHVHTIRKMRRRLGIRCYRKEFDL